MSVDTSAEAIEARAKWHDNETGAWRSDGGNVALARIHEDHAATLRALAAERDAARAEAARMRVAVVAFVAWLDSEDRSPNYGALTRDTHPEGELIWREWWDRNLRLCKTAQAWGRAALAGEPAA